MREQLEKLSSIAVAGRNLLQALGTGDEAARTTSVDELVSLSASASPSAFRFEATGDKAAATPQSPDEKLLGAVLEFQTANVVLAAGSAAEHAEAGHQKEVGELQNQLKTALTGLESTTSNLRGVSPSSLGFEPSLPEPAARAPSKATTVEVQGKTKAAVETLVDDSAKVVAGAFERLQKVDPSKVLAALSDLGSALPPLKAAGRLISIGLTKLKSAYEALVSWIGGGSGSLDELKKKINESWENLKQASGSKKVLAFLYRRDEIEVLADRIAKMSGLDEAALGSVNAEVEALTGRFASHAKLLETLLTVVGVTTAILVYTPAAGHAGAVAAGVYVVIVAAVLVMGSRYAGGRLPRWGHGIKDVVLGVLPQEPPTQTA